VSKKPKTYNDLVGALIERPPTISAKLLDFLIKKSFDRL